MPPPKREGCARRFPPLYFSMGALLDFCSCYLSTREGQRPGAWELLQVFVLCSIPVLAARYRTSCEKMFPRLSFSDVFCISHRAGTVRAHSLHHLEKPFDPVQIIFHSCAPSKVKGSRWCPKPPTCGPSTSTSHPIASSWRRVSVFGVGPTPIAEIDRILRALLTPIWQPQKKPHGCY